MKWTVDESTVKEVSERQKKILQSCSPLVKPGGRLVYATCTMFKQENEEVVEQFLSVNPLFTPKNSIEAAKRLGIESAVANNVVKLLPQVHGTDGFFCAMLEKGVA
jgi:16S rRNA (cytosine967-C5)-methyltransferase